MGQIERGMNNMHFNPNADQFDRRPNQYHHNGAGQNYASNNAQGGNQRSQSFSGQSKNKNSSNGELRMYSFEKYPVQGRMPGWELAERIFMDRETQADLVARIKKPSKDSKGNSNAKTIDSDKVAGKRGYKRDQIFQLLSDLNYSDPNAEWQHKLIELPDKVSYNVPDNKAIVTYDKMIVIVKRQPRNRDIMPLPRAFNVMRAVVDVSPQVRQGPQYQQPNGIQQIPNAHGQQHAAGPAHHAGPLRPAGASKPVAISQPAGHSQRNGPSYEHGGHGGHDPRAGPAHKSRDEYDDSDDLLDDVMFDKKGKGGGKKHMDSDEDMIYGKKGKGGKKHVDSDDDDVIYDKKGKGARRAMDSDDEIYDKKAKGAKTNKGGKKTDKTQRYDLSDSDAKKGKKKQKAPQIYHSKHSKSDSSDTDSSYDSFRDSAGSYRTAGTDYTTLSSSPDVSMLKRYLSINKSKNSSPKRSSSKPEANREHHRKNPSEYHTDSRASYGHQDVLLEPASPTHRHHPHRRSSVHSRNAPSFHRDRPSRPVSVEYDGYPDSHGMELYHPPSRTSQPLDSTEHMRLVAKNVLLEHRLEEEQRRNSRVGVRYDPRYDERVR